MIKCILKDHFWGCMDVEFQESNINGGDIQLWLGCRNFQETTTFTLTTRKSQRSHKNNHYFKDQKRAKRAKKLK